ncbi:MAG: isoprenyl transferase [Coriobacteriaceae bacterium]|nr:isoprenyl transferase [Coriobacteriaceae bacterium]
MSDRPATIREIFPDPPEGLDCTRLDRCSLPQHVAIIMDGNGRWAEAQGLDRSKGHSAGIKAVREAITTCNDLGIGYLTIYSFSTENWNRPKTEVNGLMDLFAETMDAELGGLDAENVRVRLLGRTEDLPRLTRSVFERAAAKTKDNDGMTLAIAVNYGSRLEIVDAVQTIAQRVENGDLSAADIDEMAIADSLYTADMPDPDLLIRTSGEMRLSNFLLWQVAYAEIYVTDVLWPDFDRYELCRALLAYQDRDRRYGKV